MTERIGIIDLGSNSARLIVMHIYANNAYNLIYHQKETVRLSEGTENTDALQPGSMGRAVETLKTFAHMCRLFKVDKLLAIATAAVRNAQNGPELLSRIEESSGIRLEVISGKDEAQLGYTGIINTIDIADAVLFDLGGGSTELTLVENRRPAAMISLPFGAVNLTEKFATQDRVSNSELSDLYNYISRQLKKVPWLAKAKLPVVGVGGTARNIAKMDQRRKNYPFNKVHNYRLGDLSLNELWRTVCAADYKQRTKIPGLSSERADIILAGTTIVKALFDITRANQLIVSGCGVREGLFLRYYQERAAKPEIIDNILLHSAHNMLLFYKGNADHAYHVAALAEAMFDGWRHLHQLEPRDRILLRVAALLHDIGITINFYDHARHSAYLVENARLFGLTHREQMLTAVVAGWHNGPSAKNVRNRLYSEFLGDADWQKARKMALLLALAESLDKTQMGVIQTVTASSDAAGNARLDLTTAAGQDAAIEFNDIPGYRK